jgi:signal transduction histidine kinase/CheY-like chemotaxis protein
MQSRSVFLGQSSEKQFPISLLQEKIVLMNLFHGSIRKKLVVLVSLATMPVFLVLLGMELQNRSNAVALAEKDTAIYLSGFAEIQRRITNSTQTLLRTVASIPDISNLDVEKSRVVLAAMLEINPIYTNVILVDLNGDVVAAGRNHDRAKKLNFGDRKQFKEAIASKGFASGEFVVGKSSKKPIFPFGIAVLNKQDELTGAIIIGVSLAHYGEVLKRGNYPPNTFFGLCDHNGLRLFRYPTNDSTAIGKPIQKKVYAAATSSGKKGNLFALTSDGTERIVAYQPLLLEKNGDAPYMYMFMGFDYEILTEHADSILSRLLVASFLSLALALFIAWFIGGRSVARLIDKLSFATKMFSQGEKNVTSNIDYSDGEIGGLAESFDDMVKIIRQREAEKSTLVSQLNQAQKMDAIGQLAGGIAHDFNNMLGGILGAGELLAKYLPDDPKAKKFHQLIIQSATRAADLTGKLLTFSRTSGKISSIVDAHDIINEITTILENTTDRRIKVETDLKANPSSIVGDPSQLQSALLNLGINSSQAMSEGGTLSFSSRLIEVDEVFCQTSIFDLQPGQYLEIEVSDSGCGIPSDYCDKIFEPFFTTKKQGKGTGLGLSAVYGTIKQHAGSITVYSELGVGTTFKILLPLAMEEATAVSAPQELLRGEGTILIVDDEEVMRVTACAILENLGYSIILAENGEDAISIFKGNQGSIDLIVLDMMMPVMNGKDCFMALQQLDPQVRVVLSSGFTHEEDLEDMRERGLKGFIRKPYLSGPLSRSVYEALH